MSIYRLRRRKDLFLGPVADIAYRNHLTPNRITALGLCAGVACGWFLALHQIPMAITFGILSVFCDVLDGTIARRHNLESKLGLGLDSLADRVCELAVVIGALLGGIIQPLGAFAIIGSSMLLVSRSISHMYGSRTDYVFFGRLERLLFILIGLLMPNSSLSTLCFVIAGSFGFVSSLQIIFALSKRFIFPSLHSSAKGQLDE
jgi:phosphatidylglycerophosphate synthase